MTIARKEIVSEGVIGIYHCISRCVRQAFLCGIDAYTGKSYEHRKGWIRNRLQHLAEGFAVDIFAYAVMANHLHVVIQNRPDVAENWSDEEIALRWLKLFPAYNNFDDPDEIQNAATKLARNEERILELRKRLSSVSWFMRCLNEHIARRANNEDECKGRFWEGRFKSQALLDESAVLACMAYVDLNPIRAGIAATPETSFFTSVHERIMSRMIKQKSEFTGNTDLISYGENPVDIERKDPADWLTPFSDEADKDQSSTLNMSLDEYLNLVDWTGRWARGEGKASIPGHIAPILSRLNVEAESWTDTVRGYGGLFRRAVGRIDSMVKAANNVGLRWFCGMKSCARSFSAA